MEVVMINVEAMEEAMDAISQATEEATTVVTDLAESMEIITVTSEESDVDSIIRREVVDIDEDPVPHVDLPNVRLEFNADFTSIDLVNTNRDFGWNYNINREVEPAPLESPNSGATIGVVPDDRLVTVEPGVYHENTIQPIITPVSEGILIGGRETLYREYDTESTGDLTTGDGAANITRELNETLEPQTDEPDSSPTEEVEPVLTIGSTGITGTWARYTIPTITISAGMWNSPIYNFGAVDSKPLPEPKPILNPKRITRRVLNMAEEGWVVQ